MTYTRNVPVRSVGLMAAANCTHKTSAGRRGERGRRRASEGVEGGDLGEGPVPATVIKIKPTAANKNLRPRRSRLRLLWVVREPER